MLGWSDSWKRNWYQSGNINWGQEVVEWKVVSEVEDKVKVMKEVVDEKMEVERRKSNLIMHRLQEGDDDLERVKELNDGLKL